MTTTWYPCAGSSAWDLPDRGNPIEEVRTAVGLCSTCPALAECRAAAVTDPPTHRCVQGGLVFDQYRPDGRQGMSLEQWMIKGVVVRTTPQANPDGLPCAFCDQTMPRSSYGRKYCSERCKRKAGYRKAMVPPGEPCRTCGVDPGDTPHERASHHARHAAAANRAQAAERGKLAVRMVAEGMTPAEVARQMRVHPASVKRWLRLAA